MKQVQHPRMTSAQLAVYIGPEGQIIMNSDLKNIHLQDGVTPGGQVFFNETQIGLLPLRTFNSIRQYNEEATLDEDDVGAFVQFTGADTYTLMHLSDLDVGVPVTLFATVAGVIIECAGTDIIADHGADVTSMNLTQYETTVIAKQDIARWRVMSRY